MVRLTYITFKGKEQTVEVSPGISLMEAAVANAVEGIDADCGGNCYCGTCRVFVSDAWRQKLADQDEFEQSLLEANGHAGPTVRLSCQIPVTQELDGLVVRLPETQK